VAGISQRGSTREMLSSGGMPTSGDFSLRAFSGVDSGFAARRRSTLKSRGRLAKIGCSGRSCVFESPPLRFQSGGNSSRPVRNACAVRMHKAPQPASASRPPRNFLSFCARPLTLEQRVNWKARERASSGSHFLLIVSIILLFILFFLLSLSSVS